MARRHTLEAEAGRYVLTLPFRLIVDRIQKNDPETLRQLNAADIDKLLKLAGMLGKHLPPMQAAERLARGLHTEFQRVVAELAEQPTLADHCLGNDEREDALCEFLERITTAGAEDDLSREPTPTAELPNEIPRGAKRPLGGPLPEDE